MADMGLMDRPATPNEIAKICQAVLIQAQARKAKPLAPKLMVPEEPDEASAKQALFTVMRPQMLENALTKIPNFHCGIGENGDILEAFIYTTFARQDEIRQVLADFGVCPIRRKHPPRWARRPGSCSLRMRVPLPKDWRLSSKP